RELYRHIAREGFEVAYVGAYDWPGPAYREQRLAPDFLEVVTPLTQPHFRVNRLVERLAGGKTVIDVTIPYLLGLSPRYRRLAMQHGRDASAIIISHPWVYPHVARRSDQLLIYDAHNCEYLVKRHILGDTVMGRLLASAVGRLERRLCRDAHVVFACSDEDAEHLATVSKTARDKFVTVPNGVDVDQIRPVDAEERRRLKAELGLVPDRAAAIFIGSGYLPNVE